MSIKFMDIGGKCDNEIKGIIFDMDNTILRSNIDFKMMKIEIFELMLKAKILSDEFKIESHTVSTIIAESKKSAVFTDEIQEKVWKIVTRYECAGMKNAGLEPGAAKVLDYLHERYLVAILTNNSYAAVVDVLNKRGIKQYFHLIVGREQVSSLKPSSEGVYHILRRYPHTDARNWISVGDSWMDGIAAKGAGVGFVDYQGDLDEIKSRKITPVVSLKRLEDLITLFSL